ncbi:MAG: helix-turn-helix domain-containing protein [Spirochaetales bacterium]|nr:helix-turn-helix domain-containing protein [Spirochaetales bacterium]
MKVFVYSMQPYIGQIICDHLAEKGHQCFCFQNQQEIGTALMNIKTPPDLLVLDFTAYNHDDFDIYKFFLKQKLNLPLVFYNEPCLTMSTRARHWKSQIMLNQNSQKEHKKVLEIEKFDEIFKDLEELVESDELSPYISLMQKPKPLPEYMIPKKYSLDYIRNTKNDFILEFKKRAKLPENLFYLLSILQANKDFLLSLSDIQRFYKKDGKEISENSLKVLISRLRSKIREDKQCKFIIRKTNGMYQFVKFITA